jgi:hypothetical protein
MTGPARKSLDEMIASAPELQHASASALVHLGRVLANQMDSAGSEPSTRLSAAYLSVLVNLRRLVPAQVHENKPASRLTLIKSQASKIGVAS